MSRCFFQAEDGIRDYKVTGVQTCALPISSLGLEGAQGRSVLIEAGQLEKRPGGGSRVRDGVVLANRQHVQLDADGFVEEVEIGRASCRERGEVSAAVGHSKI